jgi:hypothetical protein
MKKMIQAVLACTIAFTIATSTGCTKDDNSMAGVTYSLSGNASGSQMVPSVTGTGAATMNGTYDPNTRMMTYTTNWNGMTGAPTSGGFYTGASGSAGTAFGTPWTMGTGWTGTGTTSGSTTLTADQATQLMNGNMYYSMGTATNASGEVRGQMTATMNH